MKFRGPLFFSFILATFIVVAFYPKAINQSEKEAMIMRTILAFMDRLHYEPKVINDEFSEDLYDLYLKRVDYGHRFLTQEDIAKLEPYQDMLDDEAKAGTFNFFDLSLERLEAGIEKTQGYYREILAEPFDFTLDENIQLNGEKRGFAENDEALREYWRKFLKYETMTRLATSLEEQEGMGEEGEKKSMEELEQEAREDVLKRYDDYYSRLAKIKRNDRLSYYLNALTNIFDPHSVYFDPVDKQSFDINFSGRLEGIGATLQSQGDYTKVARIVVGGPAWKGKELQENDLIMKVAQGDENPVDIAGMSTNEVVTLIRGDKGTEVRLTVKKVDGTIKNISIIRDVVVLEENYVRSLILDGPREGERFGYIFLPSFYGDFQDPNGRFSAEDVKNEIAKLQEEKVDGIILDIRNNGGGLLSDVVKMSGYFIEEGPVVQVKARDMEPEVLSDKDPSVLYNGPLAVMVNSFSASASEILSAALQDYDRAVIVGSNSTFGKGTVQRFFDLDRLIRGHNEVKPLGEVKVTTQKFYRIDGGSVQLRGVVPDIVLPDSYQFMKMGERDDDYAMSWTSIDPVPHEQHVYRLPEMAPLRERSEARVAENSTFQNILDNARRLEAQREDSEYSLKLEEYMAMSEEQEKRAAEFEKMMDQIVNQGVRNLEVDLPSIHADESKEARNDEFIKSVSQDIHIKETLNIMHDLVTLE